MSVIKLDDTKRPANDNPVEWFDSTQHNGDSDAKVAGTEFTARVFLFGRFHYKISYSGKPISFGVMPIDSTLSDAKRAAENSIRGFMVHANMVQEG